MQPVKIDGVEISRATLHNQDEIDRKGVRIGDWVIIQRAGDVIPEVVKVIESKRTGNETDYRIPEKCPECGSVVVRLAGEVVHRCAKGMNKNMQRPLCGNFRIELAQRSGRRVARVGVERLALCFALFV